MTTTAQNPVFVWIPVVTAVLTFILTSLFTIYRERKTSNASKRIFFSYSEYEMSYPFDDEVATRHGEGMILFGKNGTLLREYAMKFGPVVYSFFVLKNVTVNDAINVKMRTRYSDKATVVEEEFGMPTWQHDTTLYLPQSIFGSGTHMATNEELTIWYMTTNFEQFKYSFKRLKKRKWYMFWRKENAHYKETLSKRYFMVWVRKVRYVKTGFYSHQIVRKKSEG